MDFGKPNIKLCLIMAYSIYGDISYILEANSNRPIREKRKEIEHEVKLCWTNWMGWLFSFFSKNISYLIFFFVLSKW